jgi:Family of unknown function (DUF6085)
MTVRRMRDPGVRGHCPMGCGESLFLGSGGYITCGSLECPAPTAVSDLIAARPEPGHIVLFHDDDTFTIEHPVRERIAGSLFACALHNHLVGLEGPPVVPGRYRVTPVARGWKFNLITENETETENG